MSKPFEEMTEEELDKEIDAIQVKLKGYRQRYRSGIDPTDEDRDWYRRASTALAAALHVRNPRETPKVNLEKFQVLEKMAEVTVKYQKVQHRLSRILSFNPAAERNMAFVQVARQDLPRVTYHTLMRKAAEMAKDAEAAALLESIDAAPFLIED